MSEQSNVSSFWLGPADADTACLLIHGFMGNPQEMLGLGELLAARGMRVYGMVVAGHEGDMERFVRVGRKEWLASVEQAFGELAAYKRIFVIGFSMGGALALLLASRHTRHIAGVVTLAVLTRVQAEGWQAAALPFLPLARHFVGWFYPLQNLNFKDARVQNNILEQARLRDPQVKIDFNDPQTVEYIKKLIKIPIPSIDELVHLTREERRKFARVQTPLLIIHSRHDQTAAPSGAEELYQKATAALPRSLHWLEKSDHMLVTGPELGEVDRLIAGFIKSLEQ